jgi:hypothetical protein
MNFFICFTLKWAMDWYGLQLLSCLTSQHDTKIGL